MSTAAALILVSGMIHAVVNTIVKAGKDKLSSRALIDGSSAIFAAFALPFVEAPHGAWGWLAASWLVHLAYLAFLVQAYSRADMTVVYPILRGVAPALTALVSVFVFGEPLRPVEVLGIGLVSAGVVVVGAGRRVDRRALGWALATGATISLYTVFDAQGVRAAPSAVGYIVWFFVLMGGGIGGAFAAWRGPAFLVAARSEWRAGLSAGALSILTYGLALAAFRLGGTARLAALRECSILFALLLGIFVLREKVGAGRALGALGIGAGAAVLLWS